jgi:hypothetical protein
MPPSVSADPGSDVAEQCCVQTLFVQWARKEENVRGLLIQVLLWPGCGVSLHEECGMEEVRLLVIPVFLLIGLVNSTHLLSNQHSRACHN